MLSDISNYICFQWTNDIITSKIPKQQGEFSFNLPTSFTTPYQFVIQRTSRLSDVHVTALSLDTTQYSIGTYNTASSSTDSDCGVRCLFVGKKT